MKPFDLKAAQAGEPIVRYYGSDGTVRPISFIGVLSNGDIVCEDVANPGAIFRYGQDELRMAPKSKKLYIVTRWIDDDMVSTVTCTTEVGRDAYVNDTPASYKTKVVTIVVEAP